MTVRQALGEARNRWGEYGAIRERKAGPKDNGRWCEVGYLGPADGKYPHEWPLVVVGEGQSWVKAFADAS